MFADVISGAMFGALEAELVAKWGYPQEANDLVRINDEVIIYTFRSRRRGPGGPTNCVVSFTIKSGVVTGYRVEGGDCPKIARFD